MRRSKSSQATATQISSQFQVRRATGRGLRMPHLFALLIGSIIGVGWITASGSWIADAGPVGAILAFSGGAALMTIIGLCYAEVMAMLPQAAGAVGYSLIAFGPRVAFWSGWLLLASYIVSCAFFAVTLAWLLDTLAPSNAGVVVYEAFGVKQHLHEILAMTTVTLLLAYANQLGAELSGTMQVVVVGMKLSLAILLASAAATAGSLSHLEPLITGSSSLDSATAVIGVMVGTPFWFAGFDVLPQAVRECSPEMNLSGLGKLIVLTTSAALAFYVMIILSASSLVSRQLLLSFQLPTYDAFQAAFGTCYLPRAVLMLGFVG